MRVLVLAPRERYDTFAAGNQVRQAADLVFCDRNGTEAEWLAAAADAEVLFVTPVTWVRESLISRMPRLKMILR